MRRYLPSKMMVGIGLVPPLLFAAVALYAAFQHNPQGEYYDPYAGGVQWKNAVALGFINFVFVYIIVFPILYIMEMLWRAEEHSLEDKNSRDEARGFDTTE